MVLTLSVSDCKYTIMDSLFLLTGIMFIVIPTATLASADNEYCEWESFNATCGPNEIILIQSAHYGRMKVGRCIKQDYGKLGCTQDVTSEFDRQCSGRRQCVIPVISLHNEGNTCPQDLKLYVEADYKCIQEIVEENPVCGSTGQFKVKSSSGTIASVTSKETSIGSPICPIVLEVEQYQRINLTMIDFTRPPDREFWYPGLSSYDFRSECEEYGTIYDPSTKHNDSICGNTKRETTVYISPQNTIKITLKSLKKEKFFMLQFEAFGCPPIVAPSNAFVKSNGDNAVVQCNDTEEAWYLTCKGTKWIGVAGNCSGKHLRVHGDNDWDVSIGDDSHFPFGILIVVALGVAIGVAIGVVMLVAVLAYMRRRRRRKVRSRSNYILKPVPDINDDGKSNGDPSNDCEPMLLKREQIETNTINREYIGTWQMKRPLPTPCPIRNASTGQMHEEVIFTSLPSSPRTIECSTLPRHFSTFKPVDYEPSESNYSASGRNSAPTGKHKNAYIISEHAQDNSAPYYFKYESEMNGKPDVLSDCTLCRNGVHERHLNNT